MTIAQSRRWPGLAIFALAALIALTALFALSSGHVPGARAAVNPVFTVNDSGDGTDFALDGVCETASGNGICTLRAAIQEANWSGNIGAIKIQFNIIGATPGTPVTLSPSSAYDSIGNANVSPNTTIDIDGNAFGTGWQGASIACNTVGVYCVAIDGGSAGGVDGFTIVQDSNRIAGLNIRNFSGDGIHMEGAAVTGNMIENNRIGTSIDGNSDVGNGDDGVEIRNGANGNTVQNNLISGNGGEGIHIHGASLNVVRGNRVGTNAAGTSGLGNDFSGIELDSGSSFNIVGGTSAADRNIFSDSFFDDGVDIEDGGTIGNVVQGNYIGTNAAGTSCIGNNERGVEIEGGATSNTIGGTSAGARNLISCNGTSGSDDGVYISGSSTTGNVVQGNYIGTDVSGTIDRGNSNNGVGVFNGANFNTIGGTSAGARNIISGNDNHGVSIGDSGTTGNLVQGNYIGTNASGTAAIGNSNDGVEITAGASSNTIGG